jgi:outer membrane protein assembly factor BamD (BamD/ComL family)
MLEEAYKADRNNIKCLLKLGKAYIVGSAQLLHCALDYQTDRYSRELYKDGIKLQNKALKIFKTIIEKYPESGLADDAQLNIGYLYSDNITTWDNDYKKAIKEYKKLIKNYPQSELVKEAKLRIKHCLYWLNKYSKN